jgi:hypothetical protein
MDEPIIMPRPGIPGPIVIPPPPPGIAVTAASEGGADRSAPTAQPVKAVAAMTDSRARGLLTVIVGHGWMRHIVFLRFMLADTASRTHLATAR